MFVHFYFEFSKLCFINATFVYTCLYLTLKMWHCLPVGEYSYKWSLISSSLGDQQGKMSGIDTATCKLSEVSGLTLDTVSFKRDTKSRWSLLTGIYARGSKRSLETVFQKRH